MTPHRLPEPDQARRDLFLSRAAAAMAARRYALAVEAAAGAVSADPGSARCHGHLAEALLGADRLEDALREVEIALSLFAEDEWLHRLHAAVLSNLGRWQEALQATDEALRVDPQSDNAHFLRGRMLGGLGRFEEARASAAQAIALSPTTPLYHRECGDLWLNESPVEAEKHFRGALALDAADPQALTSLASALLKQRRDAEAAEVARSAVRLDPSLRLARRNALIALRRVLGRLPAVLATVVLLCLIGLPVGGLAWLLRRHPLLLTTELLLGGGLFLMAVAAAISSWRDRAREIAALGPNARELHRQLEADRARGIH